MDLNMDALIVQEEQDIANELLKNYDRILMRPFTQMFQQCLGS